jgi:hypothetical protein
MQGGQFFSHEFSGVMLANGKGVEDTDTQFHT